ncbi:MAG: response regulator, partial [Desulfobaccales bacterium]
TTKEVGKGTGLGLSTVYGIVKQSGGYIQVSSGPGSGTTFRVYLPRLADAAATVKAAPKPLSELKGSETILLVEDEAMLRRLISDALRMYGYRVLTAKNGQEAMLVHERRRKPIHLLLTDVVMPRMSGRELAEHLGPRDPDLKVLYMSGYTEPSQAGQEVAAGPTAIIQKPFTPAALVEMVRQTLDGSAAG